MVVVVAVIVEIRFIVVIVHIIRIPQAEDELFIAANIREVSAVNAAQTFQARIVHRELGMVATVTDDELVGSALGHLFLLDVELRLVGAYETELMRERA